MKRVVTCAAFVLTGTLLCAAPVSNKTKLPEPSADLGTLPPADYVASWWAPPTDWFPQQSIEQYTIQTRIPDWTWLPYDNTYAFALRVRDCPAEELQKSLQAERWSTNSNPNAFLWNATFEKEPARRTIQCKGIGKPAGNFAGVSFKMKASTGGKPANLVLSASGRGFKLELDTAKAIGTEAIRKSKGDKMVPGTLYVEPAKEGFRHYTLLFNPNERAVLDNLSLTFDPKPSREARQEYLLIDFHFILNQKEARFSDLPQRRWIEKRTFEAGVPIVASNTVSNVYAWVESHREESVRLPVKGARTHSSCKLDGCRVEPLFLDPKSLKECPSTEGALPAVRFRLRKGMNSYVKFPLSRVVNGIEFNTLSCLAKIEVHGPLPPFSRFNEQYSGLQGGLNVLGHTDVFGLGVYNSFDDHVEWGIKMQAQAHSIFHRQTCPGMLPEGWFPIAYDLRSSDPAGNKTTILDRATDWFFLYENSLLPEGTEVIVTLANPRLARGLMHAGGDMERYRAFLADAPNRLLKNTGPFDWRAYLGPEAQGRLERPLPFLRNHEFVGEVVLAQRSSSGCRNREPFRRNITEALDYFNGVLMNQFGTIRELPVLVEPSPEKNTKIFIGGHYFPRLGPAEKTLYEQDLARLKGTSGFAIRRRGSNLYLYAGEMEDKGDAIGLAMGVYALIENNTDEICAHGSNGRSRNRDYKVCSFVRTGTMDLVWGEEYLEEPAFSRAWCYHGSESFTRRNRGMQYEVSGYDPASAWRGGVRAMATGHWLAHYGTGHYVKFDDPNRATWGMDENGKRIKPECYSRHNCMIESIDHAKADWLHLSRERLGTRTPVLSGERQYHWQYYEVFGFWPEDNDRWCLCAKCRTPIRLPDGSTIAPSNPLFRGVQYYANGNALVHAANVWMNRNLRIETIGYFWLNTPPPVPLSRNWNICYCPYFRKNYFEPIYAPVNDLWWRDIWRWSQIPGVRLTLYDYFLGVNLRPWEITAKYDIPALRDVGLIGVRNEGGDPFCSLQLWSLLRQFRQPGVDPRECDRRFIARTYREAAPAMWRFYSIINEFIYESVATRTFMELEDFATIGVLAARTPSPRANLFRRMSVLDELESCIAEAEASVKNPASKAMLDLFLDNGSWGFRKWCAEARRLATKFEGKREGIAF